MQRVKLALLSGLLLYSAACLADDPIVIRITNNTSVDVHVVVVGANHVDAEGVKILEDQLIYGGKSAEYTVYRTDTPAHLSVSFHAASGEGRLSGYVMGRWQYVETIPAMVGDTITPPGTEGVYLADTCHNVAAETPFAVDCTGNNNFVSPVAELTISNQTPS